MEQLICCSRESFRLLCNSKGEKLCVAMGRQVGVFVSLVPWLSLSLALIFACMNIVHEKLKERDSLVWNCTHLWPFSIKFLPNNGWEGHG